MFGNKKAVGFLTIIVILFVLAIVGFNMSSRGIGATDTQQIVRQISQIAIFLLPILFVGFLGFRFFGTIGAIVAIIIAIIIIVILIVLAFARSFT